MYKDDLTIFIIGPIIMTIVGAVLLSILFGLGWFVYGDINGGLAIMILCMLYGVFTAFAAIPYLGVFIQAYLILNVAWPVVSKFAMIEATWLTTTIFVLCVLVGLCFTYTTTSMTRN